MVTDSLDYEDIEIFIGKLIHIQRHETMALDNIGSKNIVKLETVVKTWGNDVFNEVIGRCKWMHMESENNGMIGDLLYGLH